MVIYNLDDMVRVGSVNTPFSVCRGITIDKDGNIWMVGDKGVIFRYDPVTEVSFTTRNMGVEIPEGTMVKQAVYISIDGELSGLFAINYNRTKFTAGGLATLNGYRHVSAVIVAKDFMLTTTFLKEKFGINGKRMIFPAPEEKEELAVKVLSMLEMLQIINGKVDLMKEIF